MRLRHPSGRIVHLNCGVSLADAQTPVAAYAQIDAAASVLRSRLGSGTLAIALRLPYVLAAALVNDGRARTRLRAELDARGLEVVTLSGGPGVRGGGEKDPDPCGGGPVGLPGGAALREAAGGPVGEPADGAIPGGAIPGGAISGDAAGGIAGGAISGDAAGGIAGDAKEPASLELPDWSQPARLQHTLDLARILVDLLPEDEVRGAVMSCGLGRREDWDENHERNGARHLSRLSGSLADLAWRVGRAVRAGFQPGPGCVLDSPEDVVAALTRVDKDRLGVCLDLATVVRDWAAPEDGIDRLTDAGLSVITARITDPRAGWQPVLRHLLAADAARTEYIEVEALAGGTDQAAADLAYVMGELTTLGLVPEQEACAAP
ncbi:hypothetical protein [Actinoplanes sp. NPDC051851]|uniref:hypothetical protein n=1 Tax=Actinoplanes sp. NPDC051851 TaxID=3154753 RepID=UPI0034198BC4